MRQHIKTFMPVGKVFCVEETAAQKLQRMARASLPVLAIPKDLKQSQKCVCGDFLSVRPKIRQGQKVCDSCAVIIPRLGGGGRPCHKCSGCSSVMPRRSLKMKDGKLYCKKCFK